MKLYADLPGRRLAQITADVLMVAWVAAWVWIGVGVHSVTMLLAHPGRTLELAGRGFTDKMQDAGASVSAARLRVPEQTSSMGSQSSPWCWGW